MLNVTICTRAMQRTWWPEADIIIVTGPYYNTYLFVNDITRYLTLNDHYGQYKIHENISVVIERYP